ncbi:MAG TPA: class I SAM-dependent methyltransferase [Burkholderiaceae bacterium]|nr:class I SAM-dependent methyltransferase [Burkholderiaceae bacterium]
MQRDKFAARLARAFDRPLPLHGNYAALTEVSSHDNQQQTTEAFSDKWERYGASAEKEKLYAFQLDWYLKLYGFASEDGLREHLRHCELILDAGCGLGYKAAWFARLAPQALVVGMDFSGAAAQAAQAYAELPNLFFVRGDIASTGMRDGAADYVSCDQVIMHTEDPQATFAELARVTKRPDGQFACYFYAKKALPRELLDEHFRSHCKELSREQLWELSAQLAELGRRLSALDVTFDAPAIPALGIKGGRIDVQRFLYWNFVKCYWNEELGLETSIVTNFDWYSPSNARRFSESEVRQLVRSNGMVETCFHAEEACYSGRFAHVSHGAGAVVP